MQQDLFPPIDSVLVPRNETFRRVYEVFRDEVTPEDFEGQVLTGHLLDPSGKTALLLTEGNGLTRTGNQVIVEITAAQMVRLSFTKYRLSLRATVDSFVDELLIVELTIAVQQGVVGVYRYTGGTVTLINQKSASVAYFRDLTQRVESAEDNAANHAQDAEDTLEETKTVKGEVVTLKEDVVNLKSDTNQIKTDTQALHGEVDLDATAVELSRQAIVDSQADVTAKQLLAAQSAADAAQIATQFKGLRVVGTPYLVGDRFVFRGSTYSVTVAHVAAEVFDRAQVVTVSLGTWPAGAWTATIQYYQNDLVTKDGNTYRRMTDGVSGSSFSGAAPNWELYAGKGDPGTLTASAFAEPTSVDTGDQIVIQRANGTLAKVSGLGGPTVRPSLNLNFAGSGVVSPQISHSRNGILSYFDKGGIMRFAQPNIPAIDYDPITGACLGLSLWESRTNLVRNSMMVGAVPGVVLSGGVNPTFWSFEQQFGATVLPTIALTTESGISCIDYNWNGTPTASNHALINTDAGNIPIVEGQYATYSIYARFLSGWQTGMSMGISFAFLDSVGGYIGNGGSVLSINTQGALTRISFTSTVAPTGTARVRIRVNVVPITGVPNNVTVRFGAPQCEIGTFATPFIPTTTAAATRGMQGCYLGLKGFHNATAGTWFAETFHPFAPAPGGRVINASVGYNAIMGLSSNVTQIYYTEAVTNNQVLVNKIGSTPINKAIKQAASYSPTGGAVTREGLTPATYTNALNPEGTYVILCAGFNGGGQMNGHLRAVRYWPLRLPDAQLQSLTA